MTRSNLSLMPLARLARLEPIQAAERFEALYASAEVLKSAEQGSAAAETLAVRFLVLFGNTYPGNLFLPMMFDDVDRGEKIRQVLLDLLEHGPHQALAEEALGRYVEVQAEMWLDLAEGDPATKARMYKVVPGLRKDTGSRPT